MEDQESESEETNMFPKLFPKKKNQNDDENFNNDKSKKNSIQKIHQE